MTKRINTFLCSLLLLSIVFTNCKPADPTEGGTEKPTEEGNLILHALDDPQQLNPSNAVDAQATAIFYALTQNLLNIDFQTGEMIPILAKEVPVPVKQDDGTLTVDMEIRERAKWDNGEPITGHDIAFNVKLMKVEKVDNAARRNYFEFIQDVVVDEANPKKFKLVCKPYFGVINSLGDLNVLPAYVYDADNVLANYTIADLIKNQKAYAHKEDLTAFAETFNSPKFQREVVAGSGPYKFESWDVKQRITVTLKEDWWGHKEEDKNHWFAAYPKKIVYERINDLSTATAALKTQELDAMNSIMPKTFVEDFQESEDFQSKYNLFTPPNYAYDYIGINMTKPAFEDVRTRKGLAHLMNVKDFIETACYGLGERMNTFVHPTIKKRLNENLTPYDFDIEKAKALLAEAGWGDSNEDGILDQTLNNELVEMKFTVKVNKGNKRRETAALIFQQGAKEAGIDIAIEILPWQTFRKQLDTRDFDLYMGGWASSPVESDPKQIWHSSSMNGGSNYVGFDNEKADAVIDKIRDSMDENVRNELYKELQQYIYEDMPYIFLIVQKERVAIHKKFTNAKASGIKPGYWASGFSVMEKETY